MKFTCPTFILLPRKTIKDKRIALNLNIFRNLNFIVNNQVKQQFQEQMRKQLEGVVLSTPISITYTLYVPSKRRCDIANVCSIVDKNFCDALSHFNCIEDDNYDFIPKITYQWGGIDKLNPRVEVEVSDYQNITINGEPFQPNLF